MNMKGSNIMFQMDINARFKNKAFLIALTSAILLLLKNFGLGQYIPENINSIINGFITIGILLGVISDTSTPGISDQIVSNTTVQAINKQEEVKMEDKTTSINNVVSEDSKEIVINKTGMSTSGVLFINDDHINASSKIIVANPENVVSDGNIVNAISASSPTVQEV